jgi:antitoxin HigA-1
MRLPSTINGAAADVEVADDRKVRHEHSKHAQGGSPIHPEEMLREDFLPNYGLTVSDLAEALGVSCQTVNELLRERRSVSPEMALRLSRPFGDSPEFWLSAERAVDLWDAALAIGPELERIEPL